MFSLDWSKRAGFYCGDNILQAGVTGHKTDTWLQPEDRGAPGGRSVASRSPAGTGMEGRGRSVEERWRRERRGRGGRSRGGTRRGRERDIKE